MSCVSKKKQLPSSEDLEKNWWMNLTIARLVSVAVDIHFVIPKKNPLQADVEHGSGCTRKR